MILRPYHQLFFQTPEQLYLHLEGGRRQVQDLRDPEKAYRLVWYYSAQYFQVRDLRARRVKWKFCVYELPSDLRYIQPLGEAPDNELQEWLPRVRINFTPEYCRKPGKLARLKNQLVAALGLFAP